MGGLPTGMGPKTFLFLASRGKKEKKKKKKNSTLVHYNTPNKYLFLFLRGLGWQLAGLGPEVSVCLNTGAQRKFLLCPRLPAWHSLIPERPGWASGGPTFPEAVRLLAFHLACPLPQPAGPVPALLLVVLGHPPPQETACWELPAS